MGNSITRCRVCGNSELVPILDLGTQTLCGVFPRNAEEVVTRGPLLLLKCTGDERVSCGLVQLAHSNDLNELYGMNYGYRSGLNSGMVRHLHGKVARILERVSLRDGDLVVDIGANDSTTLQAYPPGRHDLVGIDPTGIKFRQYYPSHIRLIPEFFSGEQFRREFGSRRARIVTSFSMFYDLEDPLQFAQEIVSVLADDGIWVFEQSYLPTMLATNSFDTVCHEHLEYYALRQIVWIAERAGLSILDVELNDVNGGSFSVVAAKRGTSQGAPSEAVTRLLAQEREGGIDRLDTYAAFAKRTEIARDNVREFLLAAKRAGKSVYGLGASTKGNVLLQYAEINTDLVAGIAEVNSDKFGCVAPGTHIPILSEEDVLARRPDYLLVLPWHFRRFFLSSEKLKGRHLVFPLPELEPVVVGT
jgi:NDP-4-keto-2,6-dideoxyhexose 3-C-methyltransferase